MPFVVFLCFSAMLFTLIWLIFLFLLVVWVVSIFFLTLVNLLLWKLEQFRERVVFLFTILSWLVTNFVNIPIFFFYDFSIRIWCRNILCLMMCFNQFRSIFKKKAKPVCIWGKRRNWNYSVKTPYDYQLEKTTEAVMRFR